MINCCLLLRQALHGQYGTNTVLVGTIQIELNTISINTLGDNVFYETYVSVPLLYFAFGFLDTFVE